MKISVNEHRNIEFENVYLPLCLKTRDGEILRIVMRDTGYEISYSSSTEDEEKSFHKIYELKNGEVKERVDEIKEKPKEKPKTFRTTILFSDIVNLNNRLYTKECLEQLKKQIESKITLGRIGYDENSPIMALCDCAFEVVNPQIEDNALTVEIINYNNSVDFDNMVFRTAGIGVLENFGDSFSSDVQKVRADSIQLNYIAAVDKSNDAFDIKPTLWNKMRDYIRSQAIGTTFTRTDLKNVLGISVGRSYKQEGEATMDTIRCQFTAAGYIQKSSVRGMYIKQKSIPFNMTSTQLLYEAYPRLKPAAKNKK